MKRVIASAIASLMLLAVCVCIPSLAVHATEQELYRLVLTGSEYLDPDDVKWSYTDEFGCIYSLDYSGTAANNAFSVHLESSSIDYWDVDTTSDVLDFTYTITPPQVIEMGKTADVTVDIDWNYTKKYEDPDMAGSMSDWRLLIRPGTDGDIKPIEISSTSDNCKMISATGVATFDQIYYGKHKQFRATFEAEEKAFIYSKNVGDTCFIHVMLHAPSGIQLRSCFALDNPYETGNLAVKYTYTVERVGGAAAPTDQSDYDQPPAGPVVVNTDADDNAGESGTDIPPAAAAAGVLSTAAALSAAGAAASNGSKKKKQKDEEKKKTTYRMYLYKSFGDSIRLDKRPCDVYGRVVEITPDGPEKARDDLTAMLTVRSRGGLDVEPIPYNGSIGYTGAWLSAKSADGATEGVVSFTLNSSECAFTNNVHFQLVGDPRIALERDGADLLAGSGMSVHLPFKLYGFAGGEGASVTAELGGGDCPILASVNMRDASGGELVLFDRGVQPPEYPRQPREVFSGRLVAKSGDEQISCDFTATRCIEGLFLELRDEHNNPMDDGKIFCKNTEYKGGLMTQHKDTLTKTLTRVWVGVRLAQWDVKSNELVIKPAPNPTLMVTGDVRAENTGWHIERGTNWNDDSYTGLWVTPLKPIIADEDIKATLGASCYNIYTELPIVILPDIVNYYDSMDKQFDELYRICEQYFTGDARDRLLSGLCAMRGRGKLDDLQPYARFIKRKLQDELEKQQATALQTVTNYDNIITALEWTAWLGDMATEVLKVALLGPLAGIGVDVLKEVIVKCSEIYFDTDDDDISSVLSKITSAVIKGAVGNVDALYDFPNPPNWKKVMIWCAVYYVYRFFYHWYYGEGGAYSAFGLAAADLTLKSSLNLGMAKLLKAKCEHTSTQKRLMDYFGESEMNLPKNSPTIRALDKTGYSADADTAWFIEKRNAAFASLGEKMSTWITELGEKVQNGFTVSLDITPIV